MDNTPYVYDEEKHEVVRYIAPEQQRPLSRNNYSRLDDGYYNSGSVSAGLIRSTSVPSVNGEHMSLSMHERGGSRTSLNDRRNDYASNESLHLGEEVSDALDLIKDESTLNSHLLSHSTSK